MNWFPPHQLSLTYVAEYHWACVLHFLLKPCIVITHSYLTRYVSALATLQQSWHQVTWLLHYPERQQEGMCNHWHRAGGRRGALCPELGSAPQQQTQQAWHQPTGPGLAHEGRTHHPQLAATSWRDELIISCKVSIQWVQSSRELCPAAQTLTWRAHFFLVYIRAQLRDSWMRTARLRSSSGLRVRRSEVLTQGWLRDN